MAKSNLRLAVNILFHLIPVIPAWTGHFYLLAASLLFVALPYIKTNKLQIRLSQADDGHMTQREMDSVQRALRFWKYFTFVRS